MVFEFVSNRSYLTLFLAIRMTFSEKILAQILRGGFIEILYAVLMQLIEADQPKSMMILSCIIRILEVDISSTKDQTKVDFVFRNIDGLLNLIHLSEDKLSPILALVLKAFEQFIGKLSYIVFFLEDHPERLLTWLQQVQKWLFLVVQN